MFRRRKSRPGLHVPAGAKLGGPEKLQGPQAAADHASLSCLAKDGRRTAAIPSNTWWMIPARSVYQVDPALTAS